MLYNCGKVKFGANQFWILTPYLHKLSALNNCKTSLLGFGNTFFVLCT